MPTASPCVKICGSRGQHRSLARTLQQLGLCPHLPSQLAHGEDRAAQCASAAMVALSCATWLLVHSELSVSQLTRGQELSPSRPQASTPSSACQGGRTRVLPDAASQWTVCECPECVLPQGEEMEEGGVQPRSAPHG